jgi:type IV pilus assembly protein PilF
MSTMRLIVVCAAGLLLTGCVTATQKDPKPTDDEAAVANMNLGAGYLRQGRPDLAIERLQRALDQNPRLADAHTTIAVAYDQIGSAEEAEEHYRRGAQLEPDNSAAANGYAQFLCRQNRAEEAEPYFRRAAENPRYPTPEVPLNNAGLCARNAGDNVKAAELFRAALARNPTYPNALLNMIDISYQEENYMQARAFVQRYLEAQPANAPVLLICFNVERELENRAGADRCAAQLRTGFPGSPEVAQLQALQQRDDR